jgi:asparagine synthase (glutamine-hydrolysing)
MAMTEAVRHRGPDDGGTWIDEAAGIALGHRRLSIIDISSGGHQPMISANARFVIVFNGEIYNFRELRQELEERGSCFRGGSDTEVILESCSRIGVEATIAKLNGMFAIALWDTVERRLTLARDRMGEKPVYWVANGANIIFASELKSLRACRDWAPELDRGALTAFLRHGYVPGPFSIYKGVRKLPPGSMVVINEAEIHERSYWKVADAALAGQESTLRGDEESILAEFESILQDSVARRMISDVPLGAFLSGGYDSSTIAALMQRSSRQPIKTFTIGFDDASFDESPHAEAVARHLGTDHTTFKVTGADALDVVPKLPYLYDEPFADPSLVPTHLVSHLARQQVTVVLSGDGGDELFTGYKRYERAMSAWRVLSGTPLGLREGLASALRLLPPVTTGPMLGASSTSRRLRQFGRRAGRMVDLMSSASVDDVYARLVSNHQAPGTLVKSAREQRHPVWNDELRHEIADPRDRMRYIDMLTFLPDDILVKVDRASMAVALEVRVPFLDHRLVEWTWRLPGVLNAQAAGPKYLIRRLLRRYVPAHLTDRPKMGFEPPLTEWMRGALREWSEDLLSERALSEDDLFVAKPIRKAWSDLQKGSDSNQYFLWSVLVFQSWRRSWL